MNGKGLKNNIFFLENQGKYIYYLSQFDNYKKNHIEMITHIINNRDPNPISEADGRRITAREFFNGYVREIHELFDGIDDIIKYYFMIFTIYFGMGIISSLEALLSIENNIHIQPGLFYILNIFLIGVAIGYFNRLWNETRKIKIGLDELTERNIRNLVLSRENI